MNTLMIIPEDGKKTSTILENTCIRDGKPVPYGVKSMHQVKVSLSATEIPPPFVTLPVTAIENGKRESSKWVARYLLSQMCVC